MRKISQLDWFIYKLFWYRWNKIFTKYPELWDFIVEHGEQWKELRKGEDNEQLETN